MNKTESYKNWALEELMNYVKSVAKMQTNASCNDSPSQIMPVNKNESYENWALEELMNYVKSVAEIQTNISYEDSPNQLIPVQNKIVEVEVTAISTEIHHQTNHYLSSPLQIAENREIALSPSNLTNLMSLIQDLHLSNINLVRRVTYLSQAITEFHQDLETYKVQFHAASSKLSEKKQKLEASYKTIQEQQSSIEKLTMELTISRELIAQAQADCKEQSYQLSAEKHNCRDLRTRLNREQQHSLQLKVALEKCLEVPTASYQLADEDVMLNANNLEDLTSFAPKAPPIKTWTTQTKGASNKIDLSWERQQSQSQNNPEIEQTNPPQPIESPQPLELLSSFITEDEEIEPDAMSTASAITIDQVNTRAPKSPSPLLYPSRPPKGRKSLAAIELPSFIS